MYRRRILNRRPVHGFSRFDLNERKNLLNNRSLAVRRNRRLYESQEELQQLMADLQNSYKEYEEVKQAFVKYPQFEVKFPQNRTNIADIFCNDYKVFDNYSGYTTGGETWLEVTCRYGANLISMGSSTYSRYVTYLDDIEEDEISSFDEFADVIYNIFFGDDTDDEDDEDNNTNYNYSNNYSNEDEEDLTDLLNSLNMKITAKDKNKVENIYTKFVNCVNNLTSDYNKTFERPSIMFAIRYPDNPDDEWMELIGMYEDQKPEPLDMETITGILKATTARPDLLCLELNIYWENDYYDVISDFKEMIDKKYKNSKNIEIYYDSAGVTIYFNNYSTPQKCLNALFNMLNEYIKYFNENI